MSTEILFYPGEEVTYSCQPGYVLAGSERRLCAEDGTWSGGLPTCSKFIIEIFIAFFIKILCVRWNAATISSYLYYLWRLTLHKQQFYFDTLRRLFLWNRLLNSWLLSKWFVIKYPKVENMNIYIHSITFQKRTWPCCVTRPSLTSYGVMVQNWLWMVTPILAASHRGKESKGGGRWVFA